MSEEEQIERTGFWPSSRLDEKRNSVFPDCPQDGSANAINYADRKPGDVSYTLHVGDEIFISPHSPQLDPRLQTRRELSEFETAEIPPGQFAFLISKETVRIPDNAIGFIGLRATKAKFNGLVNVSGFHADPGYHGKLVFAVFNAGPSPIHVAAGDPWFQLLLAALSQGSHEPRTKPGFQKIESKFLGPVSGQFKSLDALDRRLQRVERDHSAVRWMLAAVIGAAIAFAVSRFV